MIRRLSLPAVTIVAATLFATSCGSSSGGAAPTTTLPKTTATSAALSTAPTSGPTTTAPTTTTAKAAAAELPKPCDVLTAAEVQAATGIAVTATPDSLVTTACNYNVGANGIITMTVSPVKITTDLANGFLKSLAATYKPVPGVGVVSAVAGPPEGRLVVVTATAGFDVSRAGGNPLSEDQLIKIAKAIVA